MHTRNDKINQILITLSDDGDRVEAVELFPRNLYSVDQMIASLCKMFRIPVWGWVRPLMTCGGRPVVHDLRKIEVRR